jgi:anti-sigma-K factor RskA
MNAPAEGHNGDRDLRYAEYVLGVLDADERAAVAAEMVSSPETAARVRWWEHELLPLAELVSEVAPAEHVWTRIASATRSADAVPKRSSLWSSLALWRYVAIGASAAAVALLFLVVLRPVGGPAYWSSTIQQNNGSVGWTATLDRQRGRLIVVPGTPAALPPARAAELWLIPAGAKPLALGMIALDQPVTLMLGSGLLGQIAATAKLAVSVEPIGGSPTGQPTGAVIAIGAIQEVPASHS